MIVFVLRGIGGRVSKRDIGERLIIFCIRRERSKTSSRPTRTTKPSSEPRVAPIIAALSRPLPSAKGTSPFVGARRVKFVVVAEGELVELTGRGVLAFSGAGSTLEMDKPEVSDGEICGDEEDDAVGVGLEEDVV